MFESFFMRIIIWDWDLREIFSVWFGSVVLCRAIHDSKIKPLQSQKDKKAQGMVPSSFIQVLYPHPHKSYHGQVREHAKNIYFAHT